MKSFGEFFRRLLAPRIDYQPLVEIRISRSALLNNFDAFKNRWSRRDPFGTSLFLAPVLKSNAYGHGLALTAKILAEKNPVFFVVDSFYEALVLRREGIKTNILIIGYSTLEQIQKSGLKNCAFTIIGLDTLRGLSRDLKKPIHFHLKIDTGMSRQGILAKEIPEAAALLRANPNIILDGLCSHLADSDNSVSGLNDEQIKRWNEAADFFKKEFSGIKYFHLAATPAAALAEKIQANVCRLGLGLYGFNPANAEKLSLRPALEMRAAISQVKEIPVGATVGYGATFTASRPTSLAIIPAGYNEGVDRRLSNKGFFKIGGRFCPIVGRVSMNITAVDATDAPDIKTGDEAIIFSARPDDKNSIVNVAKVCDTIPYEILVHLPGYLRRTIV